MLLLLGGGILQIALVFTTKSTLDWATFYGVREATLNHCSLPALRKGLIPLYPGGKNPGAAQAAQAYASASTATLNPAQVNIHVLNPTPDVIQAGTTTVTKNRQNVSEVPNSRLVYAATGPRAGETLQTANLYKAAPGDCSNTQDFTILESGHALAHTQVIAILERGHRPGSSTPYTTNYEYPNF